MTEAERKQLNPLVPLATLVALIATGALVGGWQGILAAWAVSIPFILWMLWLVQR